MSTSGKWLSEEDFNRAATPPEGEFISISARENHICGIKTDGSVACWGDDYLGKATPPAGEFISVSAGVHHTCGVRTDGAAVCWGTNFLYPYLGIRPASDR